MAKRPRTRAHRRGAEGARAPGEGSFSRREARRGVHDEASGGAGAAPYRTGLRILGRVREPAPGRRAGRRRAIGAPRLDRRGLPATRAGIRDHRQGTVPFPIRVRGARGRLRARRLARGARRTWWDGTDAPPGRSCGDLAAHARRRSRGCPRVSEGPAGLRGRRATGSKTSLRANDDRGAVSLAARSARRGRSAREKAASGSGARAPACSSAVRSEPRRLRPHPPRRGARDARVAGAVRCRAPIVALTGGSNERSCATARAFARKSARKPTPAAAERAQKCAIREDRGVCPRGRSGDGENARGSDQARPAVLESSTGSTPMRAIAFCHLASLSEPKTSSSSAGATSQPLA